MHHEALAALIKFIMLISLELRILERAMLVSNTAMITSGSKPN